MHVIVDQSFSGNIADAFKNSPDHKNVVVFASGKNNEYAFDDEFTRHWVTANHTGECTWQVQKVNWHVTWHDDYYVFMTSFAFVSIFFNFFLIHKLLNVTLLRKCLIYLPINHSKHADCFGNKLFSLIVTIEVETLLFLYTLHLIFIKCTLSNWCNYKRAVDCRRLNNETNSFHA